MSVEENKAVIRNFLDEVYRKGNLGVVDEVVASPIMRKSIQTAVSTARNILANVQFEIEDLIAENDKVVARCLVRGNFIRHVFGIALINRPIATTFIGIYRIDNNQIKGFWFLGEPLVLLKQLGLAAVFLLFSGAFGNR